MRLQAVTQPSPLAFTIALAGLALISELLMARRIREESRKEAWLWAVLFVALSLFATAFFWELMWGGAA